MRELDKVIGYESIKNELYRFIDILQNPEKYKALGVSVPRGIMLDGDPGIGKTLMAQSIIKESGRKAFVIRKDRADGDFIDHIREVFEQAEKAAPSIVLLDDLDKFANEDDYHPNGEEYVTVQACIDSIKGKDVFVIATSNDGHKLPRSLVRSGRFDKVFSMTFPRNDDAKKIIAFYLKDKAVADDIDVDEIVRYSEGHSCADLEAVVNEAGILAGYGNKTSITQEDIRRACFRKFWSFNEIGSEESADSLRRKAVHESGHVVMAEFFDAGVVNFVSLEARRGGCGALVSRRRDDNRKETFRDYEKSIMISLAGKAATELILGEIDAGVNADIRNANDMIFSILDCNASYDFQSWGNEGYETSQRVIENRDAVKNAEMARYYLKTKQILFCNREFLETVIEQLIEKKTLTYKDIAAIRGDVPVQVGDSSDIGFAA